VGKVQGVSGMEEDCIGSHGPQWAVMLEEMEKENEKRRKKRNAIFHFFFLQFYHAS